MRRPCWTVALDPCVVRCATWLSGLLATTRVMFSFPWDSSGRHTEIWEHQLQRGESSRGCGAVGLSMSARVVCTYSSAVRVSSSEMSTGTVLLWLVKCTAHSLTVSPASSRQIFWRASCTLWAGVTEALRRTGVALYSMMRVEPSSWGSIASHRPVSPRRVDEIVTARCCVPRDVLGSSTRLWADCPSCICEVSVFSPLDSIHARRGQYTVCMTSEIGSSSPAL